MFNALVALAALVAGGIEVVQWIMNGQYDSLTAGELWYMIHRGSLNLTQAVIQRYVAAWLWDPVMVSILVAPAWGLLGLFGILFILFGRKKKPLIGYAR